MHNRYLFRGKRLDNGKWVAGDYVRLDGKRMAISVVGDVMFELDPATVGQCTDLRDVHDRLIFEGDVVRYVAEPERCYVVEWVANGWYTNTPDGYEELALGFDVERIGNIHDNPGLLRHDD